MCDISVIIPTRERPDCLGRALASIDGDVLEIIVVDDASSAAFHEVEAVCHRDARVRLIPNEKQLGAARCRNLGGNVATGDWLLFLDDDDYFIPSAIEQLLGMIKEQSEVDAWVQDVVSSHRRRRSAVAIDDVLIRNCVGGCSGFFVKRALFQSMGGFDPEFRSMQDWDLWLRLVKKGALHYSGLALIVYDRGSNLKITHDLVAKYRGLRRLYLKYEAVWTCKERKFHLIRCWALRQLLDGTGPCLRPFVLRFFVSPMALVYYLRWRKYISLRP